ncbi:junctional sarcoplasmic reticulum protein 1 [Corythoichthys intestinalis]|uniref:junctional sarcoplasmic reticulum protein 1 n=1 Tax=Corythoichthys intestinalis TaxID=161448 RepID=UPI0025A5891A|nr:junctional sarcoplasmic reticulum protein 1 [Corythoichthys intestinalis]XP_057714343.1 junctional sarcoplasmic reticulum protein 1 [Corythoichthys intestinalis]
MEESYETFDDELGPQREDPPPQKPFRQIRRPEMYTNKKVREDMSAVLQPPKVIPQTLPSEPSAPKTFPVQKTLSMQNLSPIETPWENVTLNRCLFVAITILVLTSGCQRLHETMRGRRTAEEAEEVELATRHPTTLRHRGKTPQPETSFWEVLFWWLPDLDVDDEEDENTVKRKGKAAQSLKSLRNKPVPDKKLMKKREGTLKTRRAKKAQVAKNEKEKDLLKIHDGDEERAEDEVVVGSNNGEDEGKED